MSTTPPPPPPPTENPDKDNKPSDEGPSPMRYTRDPDFDHHDNRPKAWRDRHGLVRWMPVGVDPNRP